ERAAERDDYSELMALPPNPFGLLSDRSRSHAVPIHRCGAPGCFTHRRMSSSRSILVRTLETASSSDETRMSKECLRITGISERLGLTATCQARPTPSAFILYPRYSVWCSGIYVSLRRPHQSPNHACVEGIIGGRVRMEERGRQGKQSSNGGQHPSPRWQACFHRNTKCEVDHDDLPQLCLDRITEVEGTRS